MTPQNKPEQAESWEVELHRVYYSGFPEDKLKALIEKWMKKKEAEHKKERNKVVEAAMRQIDLMAEDELRDIEKLKQQHKKDISLTIHKIIDLIKPVFEEWAAGSRYVTGAWNTGDDIELSEAYKNDPFWINQKRTAWEQFSYHLDSKIAGIEVTTEKKKYCFTEEYCENKIKQLKQQHLEELESLRMSLMDVDPTWKGACCERTHNRSARVINTKIEKLINSKKGK